MDKIEIELRDKAIPIYPELENLNVIPTRERQVFIHENSYGYDVVTVEPGGSAILENLTVNPTTTSQTILPDENYDGFDVVNVNAVTSSIDENIIASNIKKDVSILGVIGTLQEYVSPSVDEETLIFINNANVEGGDLIL